MLPAGIILNVSKTKLPFFRKLLYNVNYLIQRNREVFWNMDYKEIYNQWLEKPYFDEATKEELKAIKFP